MTDRFTFECKQCGACCREGFEIRICKEDLEKWKNDEEIDFLKYIRLDPKCISSESLDKFNLEEKTVIEKLKEECDDKRIDEEIIKLIEFIQKNHIYRGKSTVPLRIKTILPKRKRRPQLFPRNFSIIEEGWKRWKLVYIIDLEVQECGPFLRCPFLKINLCSIHEKKPEVCKSFPYNNDGQIKRKDFLLKFCKGIKINDK